MDDGGGSRPFMRRESNKRSFSTMAASHRSETPDSLFGSQDEHYNNEHSSRRRRANPSSHTPHLPRPGYGYDFRRPVMSTSSATHEADSQGRSENPVVIDLTEDIGAEGTRGTQTNDRYHASASEAGRTAATSSRAQRMPRWGGGRALVDLSDTGEEQEERNTSQLPGAGYLALPGRPHPPLHVPLHRPTLHHRPPQDMDDDVEVINGPSYARLRPANRRSTPAVQPAPHQRSVSPYPNGVPQTIDLTQDDDDDVVHLNTRERPAGEGERPEAMGNIGTRSLADRGFDPLTNIANILRETRTGLGGRLFNRLGAMAGLDQELQAQQQAIDVFQHNHGHHGHHTHDHHHHHHRAGAGARGHGGARPTGNIGAVRMGLGGPFMMDYAGVAFDMGLPGGNRPPTPKYSPPPDPPQGFTRSPAEDDVVVCPNCGDELAMGDSDVKQEIWVIKTCGHAYCGECAQNRSRTASKKGKGKAPAIDDTELPPPFKKCVIDKCNTPATAKSMVHVYMGS